MSKELRGIRLGNNERVRFLASLFLIIFISSILGVRAELAKVYELDFKENQTFYMFAGAKGTVRLKGIPSDVDIIQVQVVQEGMSVPKANILGKRNKVVEHASGLANYVDFNVEVLPEESGRPSKGPIELKFKSFRKLESGSYQIVSDTSNYIRTKHCAGNSPSCGLIKVKCRPHSTNCVDGMEDVFTSYPNECEVEKAGAILYSKGACGT